MAKLNAKNPRAHITVKYLVCITNLCTDEEEGGEECEDTMAEWDGDDPGDQTEDDSDFSYVAITDLGEVEEAPNEAALIQGRTIRADRVSM